jgi:uncharacterized Fe-S radical SAM superfamily protein PflX
MSAVRSVEELVKEEQRQFSEPINLLTSLATPDFTFIVYTIRYSDENTLWTRFAVSGDGRYGGLIKAEDVPR